MQKFEQLVQESMIEYCIIPCYSLFVFVFGQETNIVQWYSHSCRVLWCDQASLSSFESALIELAQFRLQYELKAGGVLQRAQVPENSREKTLGSFFPKGSTPEFGRVAQFCQMSSNVVNRQMLATSGKFWLRKSA